MKSIGHSNSRPGPWMIVISTDKGEERKFFDTEQDARAAAQIAVDSGDDSVSVAIARRL